MTGGSAPRGEGPGRASGARGEFLSSLPRRLETLRSSLEALEQLPADAERQNGLLPAPARARLRFPRARLCQRRRGSGRGREEPARGSDGRQAPAARELGRTLDLCRLGRAGEPEGRPAGQSRTWPLSVLVFGPQPLAEALGGHGANVECERTEDPIRARELARIVGPDVAVIDADRRGARELVELFAQDQLIEPVPVLVVGSFEHGKRCSLRRARGRPAF